MVVVDKLADSDEVEKMKVGIVSVVVETVDAKVNLFDPFDYLSL